VTAANEPSVEFALLTVIVIVVVDVSYLPDSVGVSVAVIVAVPALPTVIVEPETLATEVFDEEYANDPATDAVGATTVNAESPYVFDTFANDESTDAALETVIVRVTDVAAS
jgi:hypothetical protein